MCFLVFTRGSAASFLPVRAYRLTPMTNATSFALSLPMNNSAVFFRLRKWLGWLVRDCLDGHESRNQSVVGDTLRCLGGGGQVGCKVQK